MVFDRISYVKRGQLPDGQEAEVRILPAFPYPLRRISPEVFLPEGDCLFAEGVLRVTSAYRPIGVSRVILFGRNASVPNTEFLAEHQLVRGWGVQVGDPGQDAPEEGARSPAAWWSPLQDRLSALTIPSRNGECLEEPVLLTTQEAGALWLFSIGDFRWKHRGVGIKLRLQTEEPDAGYLMTHVLTVEPRIALDAAVEAAMLLWLTR
jgi:hypothetical protein